MDALPAFQQQLPQFVMLGRPSFPGLHLRYRRGAVMTRRSGRRSLRAARVSLLHKPSYDRMRIEADGLAEFQELDHRDAVLAALDGGDEGLIAAKSFRDLALRQAGALAALDQNLPQGFMLRRCDFPAQSRPAARSLHGRRNYLAVA
jgi:hypothetical protein